MAIAYTDCRIHADALLCLVCVGLLSESTYTECAYASHMAYVREQLVCSLKFGILFVMFFFRLRFFSLFVCSVLTKQLREYSGAAAEYVPTCTSNNENVLFHFSQFEWAHTIIRTSAPAHTHTLTRIQTRTHMLHT